MGNRASGMGGGISAIVDSLDACYYNPAGLTRTPDNTLSLSANLYGSQHYSVDDALFPGESFQTDSFHSVPSTAGGVFKVSSNLVMALSVFVPKKGSYFETIALLESQHYYNLSEDSETMWIGPSFGYKVNSQWSLGMSLFAVYDKYIQQQNLYWGDYQQSYALGMQYTSLAVLGLFGAQYRVNEYWSAGLTIQTPSFNLQSDGKWLENTTDSSAQGSAVSYAKDLEVDIVMPAKFTLGIAREVPGIWAFGADVSYHLAKSDTRLKGTDGNGSRFEIPLKREAVVDFNLGGEYVIRGRYPLRTGFFTSHSSAPDLSLENTYYPAQINLYGLTCSVGKRSRNSEINLGINYIFGKGHDFGWAFVNGSTESVIVDGRERYLYFTFNTSYYF